MATRYAVATGTWNNSNTAIWSAASGGAGGASVPTFADDVVFNAASGNITVTVATSSTWPYDPYIVGLAAPVKSFDCTGFTGTLVGSTGGDINYGVTVQIATAGNVTLGAGMTITADTVNFYVAENCSFTSAGHAVELLQIRGNSNVVLSVMDDFTNSQSYAGGIVMNSNGNMTFNSNDHDFYVNFVQTYENPASTVVFNRGSGTWHLFNDGSIPGVGAYWEMDPAVTMTGSGPLRLTYVEASIYANVFYGGGKTYGNVWLDGAAASQLSITGDNTINELKINANCMVKFEDGSTTTANSFMLGDGLTIDSVGGSSPFTLSCASGTVTVSGATISNSTATGGATFIAYDSVDGGGNTGWEFASTAAHFSVTTDGTWIGSPSIAYTYQWYKNDELVLDAIEAIYTPNTIVDGDTVYCAVTGANTYGFAVALSAPVDFATNELLLWLDASDTDTITQVSGDVSQWQDKSGNANHAVQGTSILRGTRVTNHFANGAVEFNGTEGMTFPPIVLTTGTTVFIVGYWNQTTGQYTSLVLANGDIWNATYVGAFSATAPSSPQYGRLALAVPGGANKYIQSAPNSVPTGAHIFEFVADTTPTDSSIFEDCADITDDRGGTAWAIQVKQLALQPTTGAFGYGGFLAGGNQFAEVLIYKGVMSSERRAIIRASLAEKWSIVLDCCAAKWNNVDSANSVTFSNGDLTVLVGSMSGVRAKSRIESGTGKWYWEFRMSGGISLNASTPFVGVSTQTAALSYSSGASTGSWGVLANGNRWNNSGASSAYGTTIVNALHGMFAYDSDTGNWWAGIDGTWFNSGNPATGTNPGGTVTPGLDVFPSVIVQNSAYPATVTLYGKESNIVYAPPVDFVALGQGCPSDIPNGSRIISWLHPTNQYNVPYVLYNSTLHKFLMHPGPLLESPLIQFTNTTGTDTFDIFVHCTSDGQADSNYFQVVKNGSTILGTVAQGASNTFTTTLNLNDYVEIQQYGSQYNGGADFAEIVISNTTTTYDAQDDFWTNLGEQTARWKYFYRSRTGAPNGAINSNGPMLPSYIPL